MILLLLSTSGTSSVGACYTWVVSTSGSGDESASPHTLFDCSPQAGRGTLLTVDPGWSLTHSFGSTTTTTSASTTATTTTSTPEPTHKSSSTNVGAIAGGTVGGVAFIGLLGLAAFFWIRRRYSPRNAPPNATLGGAPPPQGGNPPAGATYPSGVPAGYQGGYAPVPMQSPPQGYDPHMNQYGQQGVYPQQYQGQYPQQQYNYPVQTSTSPVYTTPSPGAFKEGDMSPQQQAPPTELAAVNPVGAENNRAELGTGN